MASAAATIIASVAEGSRASASAGPMRGTMVAMDMAAIAMKNSAASAIGWRQKARMPRRTHCRPVRAGTRWSFMQQAKTRWCGSAHARPEGL
jgi:hypothetical protein